MNELHLFAGAGGGILAGQLLGHRCVAAVEWEPYAQAVLVARQNDGTFPPFPIWDDVRTFDGKPWRGIVDVVAGGFPCQDISVAGKGAGITSERSGMWGHMARIVGEIRPRYVFVENSPALVTRGLGTVLSDLAALGYDCKWTVLGAADVGANHQRDRFWLVARDINRDDECAKRQIKNAWNDTSRICSEVSYALCNRCRQRTDEHVSRQLEAAAHVGANGEQESVVDAYDLRELQPQGRQRDERGRACDGGADVSHAEHGGSGWREQFTASSGEAWGNDAGWWRTEPELGRVADGVAHRAHRLKAIGNGQVPLCAATAFRMLRCGGSGEVTGMAGAGPDAYTINVECSACAGTGSAVDNSSPNPVECGAAASIPVMEKK